MVDLVKNSFADLSKRCEAATAPDPVIDFWISVRLDPGKDTDEEIQADIDSIGIEGMHNPVAYTSSMDAAMKLFPEGLEFIEMNLSFDTVGCWPAIAVRWYPPGHDGKNWHGCVSRGATPALALCNAALEIRARTLLATEGDSHG